MSEPQFWLDGKPLRLVPGLIAETFRELRQLADQLPPPTWRLTMTLDTYRMLWNTRTPMQRKLSRMANDQRRPPVRHNVRRR